MKKTETLISNDDQAIERALVVLRAGGLVAIPTDTVYGLAADPTRAETIAKLFDAKGRDAAKAIAVLVGSVEQLPDVADHLPDSARRLAAHFWPGALTLVVPKNPSLPENLSVYPTVGVRMPNHPFALALLRAFGPLATTSANRSGGPSPSSAAGVLEQLEGQVDLVIDGGECPGGVPSTVVDCSGPEVRVLRDGAIPWVELKRILG